MEKTTDLPQVTDKLYHIMLYRAQGLKVHIVRHQIYNYINNDSATCTSQIWLKIKELAPHYWLHMMHIAENKTDCHKE
jgi:hypothetical protein